MLETKIDFKIVPFISVGNISFGEMRRDINNFILSNYQYETTEDKNIITQQESITDYFTGFMLSYSKDNEQLRCITIFPYYKAIFNDIDLFSLNYFECKRFLSKFDEYIMEEEYVGFISYKLGIAIYAPDATENPKTEIECITIGEKGYFEQE